jgi:hypothetical protein
VTLHAVAPLAALPERSYKLTKLSTVQPEPMRWLLPGRIPYGGITVLGGRPGEGKSQFTLKLAADLSHGAGTIFIGAEDGLADTVVPRLIANGANLDNVQAITTVDERGRDDDATLPLDVPLIERAVRDSGAGLVIVDPFAAHLDAELNSSNDHSIRQALRPLARMAHESHVAVVVVAHPRKGRDGHPMEWIGGSGGLVGTARSVLLFGRHKDENPMDEDYRYLLHVKCNGERLARPLRCRIESIRIERPDRVVWAPRIHMEDEVAMHPEDLK